MNILVCDDDHSIVDAIEIYLKQDGYRVIKAYNGLEALKALEENEIHLIILDIMMPQLDGLQATVKIREICNIPILMLSAKSEDTDKVLGLNFGADDYITKPFNPLELLARVKSMMRRYTSLGSIAEKNNVIRIGDVELDTQNAVLTAIVIRGRYRLFGLLGREEDTVIPWEDIEVIGEDTILVTCRPSHTRKTRRLRG